MSFPILQIQRELVSGAVETEFLHTGYTNLYNNLTNVVLVVSPRAGLHEKSVLVNAHFDSTLNTAGHFPFNSIHLSFSSMGCLAILLYISSPVSSLR